MNANNQIQPPPSTVMMNDKVIQHEGFIHDRQLELMKKMEEYNKLGLEVTEYKRIIQFCKRYLTGEGTIKKKVLIGLANDVFTRAVVSSESKIAIRLHDDLFAEMPMPNAIACAERRINYLKAVSKRVRSECHFLQSQLNILLLGLDVDTSKMDPSKKPKAKPDKTKKIKKKKEMKPNPKQLSYISPDDIKMMVNNKLKKAPRKRAPLLLSSAIKALTISLLKDAAEKAIEDGSNQVTVDHLQDALTIVAECI
uniref:Centromere protein X n=1 Tax=Panagrolaimus sp. ES5 TaxID=591445 RepID=A0AC34GWX4_9BILA